MGKRFKLRLSRVIPTFQSCKSKNPSNLPVTPSPIFMLSPINPKSIDIDFPSPSPSSSHQTTKLIPYNNNNNNNSSITRHVSSAMVSVGCGCKSRSTIHYSSSEPSSPPPPPPSSSFQWKKEDKYHVITKAASENNATTTSHRRKIYASSSVSDESDDNIPLTPPSETEKKNRRKKNKKKKPKQKVRFSFSSADSSGLFSSGEETENLMSSSSTDFEAHLETIRETPTMKKKKKKRATTVRRVKRYGLSSETEKAESSPARLSVFQKLMPTSCKVEGKVKESFAVVKKSEDPFEDFKRSMVEMILEKEMFDVGDLEQLLHCFLSLNSRHHHGVIVDAFTEIWEALFCKSTLEI